ncbi:putative TFIID and and SAGA complex TAF10 subunit [Elaphomyces granulatus]|jgi:transcription initiation factor TFIID subunit 10
MADSSSSQLHPPDSSQPPSTSQQIQIREFSSSSATAAAPAASSSTLAAADLTGSDDIDPPLDRSFNMSSGDNTNLSGQNGGTNTAALGNPPAPIPPSMMGSTDPVGSVAPPTKKESTLRDFLGKMDEYAPIIPDAVTAHYLTVAGLPPPGHGPNQTPPHLARLLALATQKFIADVAADAYQYSRIRASNSSSANNPMGGLNAAAGLNMPGATNLANAAGAAAGGAGGDIAKGKGGAANTHLGIQRPGFGGGGQGGGQGRTVLTMEDLGMAVAEYGVSVKRGEFYR